MSNQSSKKITVDLGVATIVAACIGAAVALIVNFTDPDTVSDESSNSSEKKSSENIFNTSEIEIFPTTDSLESDEYTSNPEFPPETAPPASSTPPTTTPPTSTTPKPPETSTTPKITPQTSTAPKITTPTSTTPQTTSSTYFDTIEPNVNEYIHETYYGYLKIRNTRCGEAYLYKDFIDEYFINKTNSKGHKIVGWQLCVFFDQDIISMQIFPKHNREDYLNDIDYIVLNKQYDTSQGKYQSDYVYNDCNVNIKLTENGEIKVLFYIGDIQYNLHNFTDFSVSAIWTTV